MKKPAHRGATAGLSKAFLAGSTERYAPADTPRQAPYLTDRFGISPLDAAVIAELAFPATDSWREARR